MYGSIYRYFTDSVEMAVCMKAFTDTLLIVF